MAKDLRSQLQQKIREPGKSYTPQPSVANAPESPQVEAKEVVVEKKEPVVTAKVKDEKKESVVTEKSAQKTGAIGRPRKPGLKAYQFRITPEMRKALTIRRLNEDYPDESAIVRELLEKELAAELKEIRKRK